MRASVVVLAGPSGSGKSRLAERLRLPVLNLDDFYRDDTDPTLPRIATGANAGEIDWDHPSSWDCDDALAAVTALCLDGQVDVPIYDIAHNGRSGHRVLALDEASMFVAEGIFAQEIVPSLRSNGLVAEAFCVKQNSVLTFWRRLTRDLREHRKPPLFLVRRGLALLRADRGVVAHAVLLGCTLATPDQILGLVRARAVEVR